MAMAASSAARIHMISRFYRADGLPVQRGDAEGAEMTRRSIKILAPRFLRGLRVSAVNRSYYVSSNIQFRRSEMAAPTLKPAPTKLPENAYTPLAPGEIYQPLIGAREAVPELTARSIGWG